MYLSNLSKVSRILNISAKINRNGKYFQNSPLILCEMIIERKINVVVFHIHTYIYYMKRLSRLLNAMKVTFKVQNPIFLCSLLDHEKNAKNYNFLIIVQSHELLQFILEIEFS